MTVVPSLGRVAVIGPPILDVLGRPVETIPPGQGSVRLAEIRATAAGTAVDLAKLGASVTTFGAIGTDLLGDIVLAAMSGHGVDTSGVVRTVGAQTSATILPIRANGERPALHVPGATRLFSPADLDRARLREFDAVLLGGPDALAGFAADDLAGLVAAARGAGALVAVDVLHPAPDLTRIGGALAGADWFCPNYEQLLSLTSRGDVDHAVADVLALGTGGVAVTLGPDGCLVTDGGSAGALVHVPVIAADVVDTTGCGDGFTAGLIAGLLLGCEPVDAASLGVACGSLLATALGSDAGLTDLDQAVARLRSANVAVAERIDARCHQIAEGTPLA